MAVSGGITEKFSSGALLILTCKAAGAITAGNVVVLTGNADREVDVAGANSTVAKGVALRTCSIAGDLFDVFFPGTAVHRLKASGAINAGDFVKTAAAGAVAAVAADGDPRLICGYALEDIADGATGEVVVL